MSSPRPRLAVRALLLDPEARLLLVNAYPGNISDLWCAPGGGCETGQSLPENLVREVQEEIGLHITVGAPALVNEFHDPNSGFHQVEVFFRCQIASGSVSDTWKDPEGVVNRRRWFSRVELAAGKVRFKPDSLAEAAWGQGCRYDPLEWIVK
jgi:8-oxo-dGTP diphosphatase